MENTGLTDDSLVALGSLTALRDLSIGFNPIAGPGLARLAGLADLERLDLQALDPPGEGSPRDSAWLAHQGAFPRLKALDISRNGLSGTGLLHRRRLTALETLELQANRFGDDAFAGLSGLTALRHLDADDNRLTAAGLAHLRALVNLEVLRLRNQGVGDAGAAHLAGITRLRELALDHPSDPITDASAARLAGLTALEELDLSDHALTDPGLVHLAGMTALRCLNLRGNAGIVGPGLAHLAALPRLCDLDLNVTGVSDAARPHLKALTRLEHFNLNQARVSERTIARLRDALPGASIFGKPADG